MLYVYHKVKGDRLQGPEYRFLGEFNTLAAASGLAADYNRRHGYTTRGIHCAVVRRRRVTL